jgi:hypothetical protein
MQADDAWKSSAILLPTQATLASDAGGHEVGACLNVTDRDFGTMVWVELQRRLCEGAAKLNMYESASIRDGSSELQRELLLRLDPSGPMQEIPEISAGK